MFGSISLSLFLISAGAAAGLAQQPPQAAAQSTEQLQQLVAPIALYPDSLIAQILAASTYPQEIVEAEKWMKEHQNLTGDQLAQEVNKQRWDPSVKALTQFPAVLANMNQNLAWTSELGDTYVNQQQDVSTAIQTMRKKAQQAGNLNTTAQQKVTSQGQTIVIQPANPNVVYVPQYNPWTVYGAPLAVFPGWYSYPGLFLAGPGIGFGLGFAVAPFIGFGWGWHGWDYDWRGGRVDYGRHPYVSRSTTIINKNHFRSVPHASASHSVFHSSHGTHFPEARHSGAFSGFGHGGIAHSYGFRGHSSFGGFRGGSGHFHGGPRR
jgi:hypothetical protein